jgi:beta-galactosidase
MYIGADYYPEHWPRSRWETDAQLMREAGFNIVRLAEFAWVKMEPAEGVFDFAWLDDALNVLADHGISAILGTPTAVMPAWVARKYPETLAQQIDGSRITWGVRKNNCFSAGAYRNLSQRITTAMAKHFADTPNVIGWQTDNEFGDPYCYCETCRHSFQDWLRNRYETLDELNHAWGTHFWGHTFGSWQEITIPIDKNSHNPSACLDWNRHYSDLNVSFQHEQVKILREHCSKHFITHNFMGLFRKLNYYDLARDLDFVTWDNYPIWGKPEVRYAASLAADVMRGLKQKNFWIMEQTAGPGGWGSFGRNPRPGEIRSAAYQQLAHGCDGQIWFRWRTCTVGREQYWHGLLGHDGKALRRYREAADTAAEYHKLAPVLEGTTVQAQAAIIYDYDTIWATEIQPGFAKNDPIDRISKYYNALFRAGVNIDIVPPGGDFSKYKLLLAPNLYILPDSVAERLVAFVKNGGVLLADARTGVKDFTSLCFDRTLPGLLAPALGIRIEEYDALPNEVTANLIGTPSFAATEAAESYVDFVQSNGAEVLAKYEPWYLKEFAALTRNRFGKGVGWYLGTLVKQPVFYDRLIDRLLADAKITPAVKAPEGVEASVRESPDRKVLFLINHLEEAKTVSVPEGKKNLLAGGQTGPSLELAPNGVAVIAL